MPATDAVDKGLEPGSLAKFTFSKWLVLILIITTHHSGLQPVHAQAFPIGQGSGPTLAEAIKICTGISAAQGDLVLQPGDQCIQDVLDGQTRQGPIPRIPTVPKSTPSVPATSAAPAKTPRPSKTPKPPKTPALPPSTPPSTTHVPTSTMMVATTLPIGSTPAPIVTSTPQPFSATPAPLCNCTAQDQFAKKCNATSVIADPCNGNINGTAVNQGSIPFCAKLYGSKDTAFVYNHLCKTSFIDYEYGCSSQTDCVDGEVCVDSGLNCVGPVCAVQALPINCGKTFNCGLKSSCTSGSTTPPPLPTSTPPATMSNRTYVSVQSNLQAGLSSLGEYFYGDANISTSVVDIQSYPFITTYLADAIIYTTVNDTQLTVIRQSGAFNLTVSDAPSVISSSANDTAASTSTGRRRLQTVTYPSPATDAMRLCTPKPFNLGLFEADGTPFTSGYELVASLTGPYANSLVPLAPIDDTSGVFTGTAQSCLANNDTQQCQLVVADRHNFCSSWAWWEVPSILSVVSCGNVTSDVCFAAVTQAMQKEIAQCDAWQMYFGDGTSAGIASNCIALSNTGHPGRRLLQAGAAVFFGVGAGIVFAPVEIPAAIVIGAGAVIVGGVLYLEIDTNPRPVIFPRPVLTPNPQPGRAPPFVPKQNVPSIPGTDSYYTSQLPKKDSGGGGCGCRDGKAIMTGTICQRNCGDSCNRTGCCAKGGFAALGCSVCFAACCAACAIG